MHQNGVFGMRLDMFLQILGPLEGLAAELAPVGFQRNMDADMRCNVIALDDRDGTITPSAR
jgi:hypothetical protein